MSNKLQNKETSDEVDLGVIFIYLEKIVIKIGQFLSRLIKMLVIILKKTGIFFLFTTSIFKKHFIKVVLAGVACFALLTVLDKYSSPLYQSNMILYQNYRSGKLLYNNISRYNLVAQARDSVGLSKQLNIDESTAAKIIGFEITDNANKNELLKEYYDYITNVDSTLIIPFVDFKEQYDLENLPLQTIYVFATNPEVYNGLSDVLIATFEQNKFFKNEKRKFEKLTNDIIDVQKSTLSKSDTLQKQYIDLLNSYYGSAEEENGGGTTTLNLNLTNKKEKIETKEFELFKEQRNIKLELTKLADSLERKKEIMSLQSDFTPPIVLKSIYKELRNWGTLIIMLLVLTYYLIKEFGLLNYIDKYGTKDQLLGK